MFQKCKIKVRQESSIEEHSRKGRLLREKTQKEKIKNHEKVEGEDDLIFYILDK